MTPGAKATPPNNKKSVVWAMFFIVLHFSISGKPV